MSLDETQMTRDGPKIAPVPSNLAKGPIALVDAIRQGSLEIIRLRMKDFASSQAIMWRILQRRSQEA